MNKTKIIATIGPVSKDKETLKQLMLKGIDVARINLKHADNSFCLDIINKIKHLNEELNLNVAIMIDIMGPNVRTGRIANGEATLTKGDKIRIYMDPLLGDSTKFSVTYPKLVSDVKFGTMLKIDDGKVSLKVCDRGKDYIICEVIEEGVIREGKSVNAPGVHLNIPFLSEKDISDIKFASKHAVDFIALSFVSHAEDLLEVNDLLIDLKDDHMGVIAKVENDLAVTNIDEIITNSDGIMIARGDLGVEVPMERVPALQKMIVNKCHDSGKISIVATELLSSMEEENRPTRAEVSDIANAVIDGTDAVMLCGETTIGKYPVETLETMEKIIKSAEEDIDYMGILDRAIRTEKQDTTGIVAYNVVESANRLKCKAIFTATMSGYTAKKISRFRPMCPIIAITPDVDTAHSLALNFGVTPILIDELKDFDRIINKARKLTKDMLNTNEGDKIIVTGGYPFKEVKHTNFMVIEEL